MKNRKKYMAPVTALILILILILCLAACGGGSGGYDAGDYGTPESFEGLVKDSKLLTDYVMYWGTWIGEDNSELIVEMNDEGDEVRYELCDSSGELTASGFVQYIPEYSADYFYNEHDGLAYHSWFDEDGTLYIDTFGTFSKVSGDVPGENIGDIDGEYGESYEDYGSLAGVWFQDAEADAASIIEIDEYGNWSLSERPGGDGDPTEVDWGTIEINYDGEGTYYAVSTAYEDVVYDMTVIDDGAMYWGGENDYYQKMA